MIPTLDETLWFGQISGIIRASQDALTKYIFLRYNDGAVSKVQLLKIYMVEKARTTKLELRVTKNRNRPADL